MAYDMVILGGGVAAGYAAQQFIKQGLAPEQLRIVSADDALPYDRPPLSKAYLRGKKQEQAILINPPEFYREHGIDVMLETRVEGVDFEDRRLMLAGGAPLPFDKLLIATGSHVRTLDLPNARLPGIHYLRRLSDARRIREASQHAQRAVLIGGGYIGMEVSASLAQVGLAVTVVFPNGRLMEKFFTPEMSAFFQRYYQDRGVTVVPNEKVASFEGQDRVTAVVLESGDRLPVDLVVAGIGVKPSTELFEGTDLHLEDGVVVNKYLETNLPGIYAVGDVANYYDAVFQRRRRIEHWDNAVEQGKHVSRLMLGAHKEYLHVPYFFSDIFDLSYEFWGDTADADRVVYRGDLDSGEFSVWWLAGDTLVAAFVMGRPDEERELAPEWIRLRARIPAAVLEDEAQSLAEVAAQMPRLGKS
jgi:NADPH-dependent 2,4-dienoyl-CoA reductase/sulfur reductase-like enzyme